MTSWWVYGWILTLASGGALAVAPPPDKLADCLQGKVSFDLKEKFGKPYEQSGGTCWMPSARDVLSAAYGEETGAFYDISPSYSSCQYMHGLAPYDHKSRVARVQNKGKNYQDVGVEQVFLKSMVESEQAFLQNEPNLETYVQEQVYGQLNRAAKSGGFTVDKRDCILEDGMRTCRRRGTPLPMNPEVVRSLHLKVLHQYGQKSMLSPAHETFLATYGHPDFLEFLIDFLKSKMTPRALVEWARIKTPAQLRVFAQASARKPALYFTTHRQLRGFNHRTAKAPEAAVLEWRHGALLGEPTSQGWDVGSSFAGIFTRSGMTDWSQFAPSVRREHERLRRDCEVASAELRQQALRYLCAGIPLLAGYSQAGVEAGPYDAPWTQRRVLGPTDHALILMGVEATSSGTAKFVFRNSWGEEFGMTKMDFRDACQFIEVTALTGPKADVKMKALYGSSSAAATPAESH